MSELQEPSDYDLQRLQQCINDCHRLINNTAIAEIAAGNYHRKVLISRDILDNCLAFDENKRLSAINMLASTLAVACADPDSYNIEPIIKPTEVTLGKITLSL